MLVAGVAATVLVASLGWWLLVLPPAVLAFAAGWDLSARAVAQGRTLTVRRAFRSEILDVTDIEGFSVEEARERERAPSLGRRARSALARKVPELEHERQLRPRIVRPVVVARLRSGERVPLPSTTPLLWASPRAYERAERHSKDLEVWRLRSRAC